MFKKKTFDVPLFKQQKCYKIFFAIPTLPHKKFYTLNKQ